MEKMNFPEAYKRVNGWFYQYLCKIRGLCLLITILLLWNFLLKRLPAKPPQGIA